MLLSLLCRGALLAAGAGLLHPQDAVTTLPQQYRLVFENERVRVIHVRYGPHERLPVHKHPETPTVYVYLTDSGPVRFEHTEMAAPVRRPLKGGTFRVSPGLLGETHGVVNTGEIASEFLRVELKQLPLKIADLHYRGDKPFDLTVGTRRREFTHARLAIDRVIAPAGRKATEAPPLLNESLLVALSPVQIATERLQLGGVVWTKAGERLTITPVGAAAAHVLRIEMR